MKENKRRKTPAGSGRPRPPVMLALRVNVMSQPAADDRWRHYLLDLLRKHEDKPDAAHPYAPTHSSGSRR